MKREIKTIRKTDKEFPEALKAIGKDCPETIHAMGNTDLLARERLVAVIGSRKATRAGLSKAYDLGARFAKEGCVIVSGLALGCDAAAHKGCLDAKGETIAVVATGLDLVHPIENTSLQEEILLKGGLILSEQRLGIKANPSRLVARNRIQAALPDTVIVAECPELSGTMHTVRFARKYHKAILAAAFPKETEENSGNWSIIRDGIGRSI